MRFIYYLRSIIAILIVLLFFVAVYLFNGLFFIHKDEYQNKSIKYRERYLSWYDKDPLLVNQNMPEELYNALCKSIMLSSKSSYTKVNIVARGFTEDYILSQPLHIYITSLVSVSKDRTYIGRELKNVYLSNDEFKK